MKIRQYTAPTMQEAILKIKVDLGPDAVILHTRKFKRGGFLGFFAQDMVEVLAAIDPGEGRQEKSRAVPRPEVSWVPPVAPPPPMPVPVAAPVAVPVPAEVELGPLARASAPEPQRAPEPVKAPELMPEPPVLVQAAVAPAPAPAERLMAEEHPLVEEVQDLKSTVSDLKSMLISVIGHLEVQPRSIQFPPLLQKVYERLMACDVDPSIARGLVLYLQKEQGHLESLEALIDALEMPISGLFQVSGPLSVQRGEQKVVALVGPTGVGKTTTIAKLAAQFALSREIDMALLTIDTFRVAAVEQLKTYGDIIGLPVEVVLTPQGVKDALRLYRNKDLILIDTAGRSPHNRMHLNELRSFLDCHANRETHLVLSSTTRLGDLKHIVRNFSGAGIDRLIFTKTDETDVVGGIISIAHETGLPVSYITTGQSVPDDILVADQVAMSRMLIQELKA